MGLFFIFIFYFYVQKLFCFAGGRKEKMFATALRPICLTVGVIAGKMGEGVRLYLLRWQCRCGPEQCGNSGLLFSLALSACLMTIKFPSSLILFFLDGMFDYLSEGKGGGEVGHNKHVTNVCFVFHSESHALYQIHRK